MSVSTLSYNLVSQSLEEMLQKQKFFRLRGLASCFLVVEKAKNKQHIVKY